MHRRPHQVWQTAGLHVETGRGHAGHGDIDVRPRQQTLDLVGIAARHGEGHEAAPFDPLVPDGHAGNPAQLSAQVVGQGCDPRPNGFDPPLQGILDRHPEADFPRVVRFPILKPSGVRAHLKALGCDPLGRV